MGIEEQVRRGDGGVGIGGGGELERLGEFGRSVPATGLRLV